MRTSDALAIGVNLGRLQRTLDTWEEGKHPRAKNGQFSHSAEGGAASSGGAFGSSKSTPAKAKTGTTPKNAQIVKPDDDKYRAKGKQVYNSAADFPKYIKAGGEIYVKQMPLRDNGYDYKTTYNDYGAVKYVKQNGDCENENESAVWINTAGNAAYGYRGD